MFPQRPILTKKIQKYYLINFLAFLEKTRAFHIFHCLKSKKNDILIKLGSREKRNIQMIRKLTLANACSIVS